MVDDEVNLGHWGKCSWYIQKKDLWKIFTALIGMITIFVKILKPMTTLYFIVSSILILVLTILFIYSAFVKNRPDVSVEFV